MTMEWLRSKQQRKQQGQDLPIKKCLFLKNNSIHLQGHNYSEHFLRVFICSQCSKCSVLGAGRATAQVGTAQAPEKICVTHPRLSPQ